MSTDKSPERADPRRERLIERHVPYEIIMLRACFDLLQVPQTDVLFGNALIEAFCVHARNLIDFFSSTDPVSGSVPAARHFTDDFYRPFSSAKPKGELYGRLNKQIAHLDYGRTDDDNKHIDTVDRISLYRLLEDEISNFDRHVREPYRSAWRRGLTR